MADPPFPPRPRPVQPPPLPRAYAPRPSPPQPEPFQDLTEVDREAETEPSGRPRRDAIPPLGDPLTETTAQMLRQELTLTREALPTLNVPTSLAPASIRTRSKAAVAGLLAGKYGGALLLGGVLLRAVAKQWPEFGEVIEALLQAVGL